MGRADTPSDGRGRFTATVEFDRDGKVVRVRPTDDNARFRGFLLEALGRDGKATIDFDCGTPPLPLPPVGPVPVPPGPLPDMCTCEIKLSAALLERLAKQTK
jgi:hypothetical protein